MKLNKCEKKENSAVELEILLESEPFQAAVSEAYKKNGKKYNVQGFRKGKAPRNLIEKMYGADVFYYDAINELFPDAFEEAIKEAGFEPITRPEADVVSVSLEDGAVVKVDVLVKPEIKVGKYTGLSAEKTANKVDDADVDAEIGRMRERNARILTRDGKAENGDIATIDYEGSVDGVPFDGGKGEGHKLELGSGQFIPGFEEQIVGHAAGDEFDVKVQFPKEYHAEHLAGKDAVFKTKLHEVQHKELPELDDEFAKDVSEFDMISELKADIRAKMQEDLDKGAEGEVENQLVDQIVETIEGDIPDAMYENRINEMVQDFSFRLEQQGLNLKDYIKYTGMNPADFRGGFRERAEKEVKMRLAMEAVVKAEKIEVTDDDVDAEVKRIAEKYNMEADQVKTLMPMDEIRKDLAVNKAIDFIKSKAKVTEKKPEKAAAAAKAAKAPKAEKTEKKKPAPKAKQDVEPTAEE